MDALSAALNAVHMTGAIFYYAECTAPWGFVVPPLHRVAHMLAPGTERLVPYHLVAEGGALVKFDGGETVSLRAGDVIVIPHGDGHSVTNGAPSALIDSEASLGQYLAGALHTMRLGGGGERTTFVCGYFGCERHAERLFLSGLPQVITINIRADAAGAWIENSIRYLVSEAEAASPGQGVLLSKMAEALFVQTLRRYMDTLPAEHTGWLAGARDPIVGGALAAMHRKPCHAWNVAALAAGIGTTRSVLAERFTRLIGEPPLTYLARWRLQLAARLLQTSQKSIAQIAGEVGYESQAAFNRAFKREFGSPPARYRRECKGAGTR
jgi:AraC-like DNA-binding protein